MGDVRDLSEARRDRRNDDYDSVQCTECGGVWFHAQVHIQKNGSVGGYEWPPICSDCGAELESTR